MPLWNNLKATATLRGAGHRRCRWPSPSLVHCLRHTEGKVKVARWAALSRGARSGASASERLYARCLGLTPVNPKTRLHRPCVIPTKCLYVKSVKNQSGTTLSRSTLQSSRTNFRKNTFIKTTTLTANPTSAYLSPSISPQRNQRDALRFSAGARRESPLRGFENFRAIARA